MKTRTRFNIVYAFVQNDEPNFALAMMILMMQGKDILRVSWKWRDIKWEYGTQKLSFTGGRSSVIIKLVKDKPKDLEIQWVYPLHRSLTIE